MVAGFNTASGKYCCNLDFDDEGFAPGFEGFNTASGKYCCNLLKQWLSIKPAWKVSIPQAVSTVATAGHFTYSGISDKGFNTASGKYCCNVYMKNMRVQ